MIVQEAAKKDSCFIPPPFFSVFNAFAGSPVF